jgi:predicted transcriptional regulator
MVNGMDFSTAAKLGTYISKDYAEDIFELLVNYQNISASEAASRLNLHVKTVQDFLEAMASLGIVQQDEVSEGKRPYFRYSLKNLRIVMDIDLCTIKRSDTQDTLKRKIREKLNAEARFSLARKGDYINSISIWIGEGRERYERKIKLTMPQGLFVFHLPFPNTDYMSISDIMQKAGIDKNFSPEILDIVEVLEKHNVVDVRRGI